MSKSNDLIQHNCRHFQKCGGCDYLNFSYERQLIKKQEKLLEIFKDYKEILAKQVIPCDHPYFYRHKVQLPFGYKYGKVLLGCYEINSHAVIDQYECCIQDEELSQIAWTVRSWAQKYKLSTYNEKSHAGFLRHLLLRKSLSTGEILIGLITNGSRPQNSKFLAQQLLEMIGQKLTNNPPKIVGIIQNINTRKTNVVLGEKEEIWWGRPYLKELLGDYKFKLHLSTFFQVNPYQTPLLYNEVLKNISENSRVLDLYCGVGSITLWISSKAKEVIGVEENPVSISAAKTAQKLNNIKNVQFVKADCVDFIQKISPGHFDCIVVDPPRKGLESKVVDHIINLQPQFLNYVSCNPQTLLRDLNLFKRFYNVLFIQGVDMFPQTEHIECVAGLIRKT